MGEVYERKTPGAIERQEGSERGVVSGIVVTDGEASDGHILNIDGIEVPDNPPLLFGHDDYTGTGNLGSWRSFTKFKGNGPGKSGLRGVGQIELSGSGSQLAWREDVSHMIEQGHIGGLSIRWEEIGDPQRRVNLPSDHPAFIDEKKATGRQQWGFYFEKSRMMENSVVTLGSDPSALIGRMQESEGDLRAFWRSAINHAMFETYIGAGDLVGVQVGEEVVYVERAAYDAMFEDSNARLQLALDMYEDSHSQSEPIQPAPDPEPEQLRADPPATEEADQRPPEPERLTLDNLLPVLRESRKLQAADNARLLDERLDRARGRVG